MKFELNYNPVIKNYIEDVVWKMADIVCKLQV